MSYEFNHKFNECHVIEITDCAMPSLNGMYMRRYGLKDHTQAETHAQHKICNALLPFTTIEL